MLERKRKCMFSRWRPISETKERRSSQWELKLKHLTTDKTSITSQELKKPVCYGYLFTVGLGLSFFVKTLEFFLVAPVPLKTSKILVQYTDIFTLNLHVLTKAPSLENFCPACSLISQKLGLQHDWILDEKIGIGGGEQEGGGKWYLTFCDPNTQM